MGLLGSFLNKFKKKSMQEEILEAAEWVKNNLNQTGYRVDYDVESMKEIDRFFDDEKEGVLATEGQMGNVLFGLSSFIGQTLIKLAGGGEWRIVDDHIPDNPIPDPNSPINYAVILADGSVVYPGRRVMKRLMNSEEDSIYFYVYYFIHKDNPDKWKEIDLKSNIDNLDN